MRRTPALEDSQTEVQTMSYKGIHGGPRMTAWPWIMARTSADREGDAGADVTLQGLALGGLSIYRRYATDIHLPKSMISSSE